MKTLVRVFSEHQTGKQTSRLFGRNDFLRVLVDLSASPIRTAIFLQTFDLADRLEIHFAVRAVQKRKLAGKSFAKEIARDFTGLVDFRQSEARERQTSRRARNWNLRFDVVPTAEQIAAEFLIGPRALHLLEDELIIFLNRLYDLSELAHFFLRSFA